MKIRLNVKDLAEIDEEAAEEMRNLKIHKRIKYKETHVEKRDRLIGGTPLSELSLMQEASC